jgi:hypothetical protein
MANNNRPLNYLDSQSRVIFDSVDDTAFRGQYDGSNNLIYKGFARPGSDEGDLVWQIAFLTYTGTNLTSITWPENASSVATNDYVFSWTDRASYTYS